MLFDGRVLGQLEQIKRLTPGTAGEVLLTVSERRDGNFHRLTFGETVQLAISALALMMVRP